MSTPAGSQPTTNQPTTNQPTSQPTSRPISTGRSVSVAGLRIPLGYDPKPSPSQHLSAQPQCEDLAREEQAREVQRGEDSQITRALLAFLSKNDGDLLEEDADGPVLWVTITTSGAGLQVVIENDVVQVVAQYRVTLTPLNEIAPASSTRATP